MWLCVCVCHHQCGGCNVDWKVYLAVGRAQNTLNQPNSHGQKFAAQDVHQGNKQDFQSADAEHIPDNGYAEELNRRSL